MRQTRKNKKMSVNTQKLSSEALPGKCCDATIHGLHHWYSECFEKLGWMVLAKSRGMTDKIQVYIHSLQRLKMAIEQKINKVNDKDHKDDLKIMHTNISILLEHSKKDFM
jgi:hypothetical protein